MIIDVVDIDRVAVLEPKSHPPIARYRHRRIPAQFTAQLMKLKPRKVHISRAPALVKRGQDVSQLLDVVRWHPPRLALFIEVFESTMFKRLIQGSYLYISILIFESIYINFEVILDCLLSLVNCQNLISCASS